MRDQIRNGQRAGGHCRHRTKTTIIRLKWDQMVTSPARCALPNMTPSARPSRMKSVRSGQSLDYPLYCQGVEICFQEGEIEICHLGEGDGVTNFMLLYGTSDSINFLYVDGPPGTRTSARRNTRPSAKHSTTRSAMMYRWETRPNSTHWPFLFCHCHHWCRRHQCHPRSNFSLYCFVIILFIIVVIVVRKILSFQMSAFIFLCFRMWPAQQSTM